MRASASSTSARLLVRPAAREAARLVTVGLSAGIAIFVLRNGWALRRLCGRPLGNGKALSSGIPLAPCAKFARRRNNLRQKAFLCRGGVLLARESMILDLPTVSPVARGDGGGLDVASAAAPLSAAKSADRCRFCGGVLHDFVDLGMSPLCESFLAADQIDAMEPFYPLKVMVCGACFLAQVKEYGVPDLNDFLAGVPILLRPRGVVTFEFPHLLRLIEENQFDTIYHEHFWYFSLMAAEHMLAAHGLRVFDVEELWTHGGSLRLFVCHVDNAAQPTLPSVGKLVEREHDAGLRDLATYAAFAEKVKETKQRLLEFLITAKRAGKSVVGYGAPGKGNTLLNYCGIRTDFVDYTVDRNPYKHGRFLPGTHIPVLPPERIAETRPDYLLILPWNLREEIMAQMAFIRGWGGQFVVPIPEVRVYP